MSSILSRLNPAIPVLTISSHTGFVFPQICIMPVPPILFLIWSWQVLMVGKTNSLYTLLFISVLEAIGSAIPGVIPKSIIASMTFSVLSVAISNTSLTLSGFLLKSLKNFSVPIKNAVVVNGPPTVFPMFTSLPSLS